ncbi:flagellar protein FlaG [Salinibacillus kushneri]|uniref:Flagellar protein FlaG n=1 Tax=Salinibacillus kushneri TaxID=237682 RepID=A0A1H9YQU7_9BACI|nr:flagellar protein FlaG [Salinibacillus kushneri]SES71458.1 flagellar protein FlaG [Salinibacillus kushneri]
MDVGKVLSGSQLLQRSEHSIATSPTIESTNADGKRNENGKAEDSYVTSISRDEAKNITEGLNKFLEPIHTSIRYEFHEKLEDYYVTIVDQETDEVIKEIPPKKMLDMYAAMAEFMGFIVDEKV